jgi:hypothetical protein
MRYHHCKIGALKIYIQLNGLPADAYLQQELATGILEVKGFIVVLTEPVFIQGQKTKIDKCGKRQNWEVIK